MSAWFNAVGEHAVLDRLDLGMDRLQHRRVVVDDEVEDGIEDVVLAVRERDRAGFAALAHGRIGRRGAMAHRHYVAAPDEQMGLAERDASVHQLGGPRHDKQRFAVLLEFRILMRLAGILDRERMQVELRLHAPQQFVRGLEQADPHHVARPLRPGASLLDREVGDPLAAHIGARRDDPRLVDRRRRRCELNNRHLGLPWLRQSMRPQTRRWKSQTVSRTRCRAPEVGHARLRALLWRCRKSDISDLRARRARDTGSRMASGLAPPGRHRESTVNAQGRGRGHAQPSSVNRRFDNCA